MLKAKLTARRGETLAEVLVAILLISIASAMLAVALNSALRMNDTADEATRALYEELSYAEAAPGDEGDSGESTGTVSVTIEGFGRKTINVTIRGASDALRSYGGWGVGS